MIRKDGCCDLPKRSDSSVLIRSTIPFLKAFILSSGKTHWRTVNRGKTWQSFDTPEPPAVRAGAP